MLGLLLARQGVPVVVLEAHTDFDREFRGDLLQPAVMEIMGEIGLAERVLEMPHVRITSFCIHTTAGTVQVGDPTGLKCRYPFITVIPQTRFLELVAAEAMRYPNFSLVLGANVQQLIEEDGVVRGVRYQAHDGRHEVRARLTVGADGRFSRVRKLAGIGIVQTAPPIDVLWMRMPRSPQDPKGGQAEFAGYARDGRFLLLIGRSDSWQLGYVFPKGGYQELKAAGIAKLRTAIAETVPWLADRAERLTDWQQVSLLSTEVGRAERWQLPGLLLIGDAAHIMTPVGAAGINYAIQDAVVASNLLGEPLKNGTLHPSDLEAVERQRRLPTRFIQRFQSRAQERLVNAALQGGDKPFQLPLMARVLGRLPIFRYVMSRFFAFGLRKVHVKPLDDRAPLPAHAGK
jgi:2-polyprenyl-6-methoxyphenol hydroxylase-like FAD-dependent oxidoreductase